MWCPNCKCELELTLILATREETPPRAVPSAGPLSPIGRTKNFVMNNKPYTLSDQDILGAAATLEHPGTIQTYYVELPNSAGKIVEFPIKQVVRQALRTRFSAKFSDEEDRKSFTAQRARDVLIGLGFMVKRRY